MTLGPYIAEFCNQETKKKWEGINSTHRLLLRLPHELGWDLIPMICIFRLQHFSEQRKSEDDGVGNGNGQHPLTTILCSARIPAVRHQIAILQICISLLMTISSKLYPSYHVSPPINDCQVVRLSPDGMCYVLSVELL